MYSLQFKKYVIRNQSLFVERWTQIRVCCIAGLGFGLELGQGYCEHELVCNKI